jgi:hypothetical protein
VCVRVCVRACVRVYVCVCVLHHPPTLAVHSTGHYLTVTHPHVPCTTLKTQAAGTAAAYATTHGVDPIALKDHPEAAWSIQQQLIRDDALVIGVYNADTRDHALRSKVTSTSETTAAGVDGRAVNVISGQSRALVWDGGVPASQGINGSNRWISASVPAAISFELAEPTAIAQVRSSSA